MNMLYDSNLKEKKMKAKKSNPYDKGYVKSKTKAYSKTEKSVKPVAKDTNKTRRAKKKPTKGNIDG